MELISHITERSDWTEQSQVLFCTGDLASITCASTSRGESSSRWLLPPVPTRLIRSHRNRHNSLCQETAARRLHPIRMTAAALEAARALADNASLFVLRLAASYRLLFDVHQVTVHAWTARKRRNDAVRVAVLDLLVSEGLLVQNVAVLHGHLAMEVRAHLVG